MCKLEFLKCYKLLFKKGVLMIVFLFDSIIFLNILF